MVGVSTHKLPGPADSGLHLKLQKPSQVRVYNYLEPQKCHDDHKLNGEARNMMNLTQTTISREKSSRGRYYPLLLGCFALLLLASHWLHLRADPSWRMGFLTGQDWAGDFFTDEGWEANAAARAVLNGHWHAPDELNLAVESPLWPAILYYPFKVFGVS